MSSCQGIVDCGDSLLLKLRDAIDLLGIGDIQQVMWDERSFLRRHFGRADIQATIYLARIGGDNFPMKMLRQCDTQCAFARCGWSKHNNQRGCFAIHRIFILSRARFRSPDLSRPIRIKPLVPLRMALLYQVVDTQDERQSHPYSQQYREGNEPAEGETNR